MNKFIKRLGLAIVASLVFIELFSGVNFVNKNAYICFNDSLSKLKISKQDSVNGWHKQAILKSEKAENYFLLDNQVWKTNGDQITPEETFEFEDDYVIPDNQILKISSNVILDGQGHDLVLGKYSQVLIDSGITVTFKNMVIKNTLNTTSCPPIRCIDYYGKACFDNIKFAFNNDWSFRSGQFFIHNDVVFTGSSSFIYNSVRPSYITQKSNLIFSPQTTLDFSPNTVDNSLIQLIDKSSNIMFDGSTLRTTNTGLRLTKGRLFLDNNVTLSYNAISFGGMGTQLIQYLGSSSTTVYSVSWSPDGKNLAVGSQNPSLGYELQIYNTSLAFVCGYVFGVGVLSVAWSPDGRYVAAGGGSAVKIYSFNNSSLTFVCTIPYSGSNVYSVSWSPDGRYLAIGGDSNDIQVYLFDDEIASFIDSQAYGSVVYSISWNPGGDCLAIGGDNLDVQVYSFNGSVLTFIDSESYGNSILSTSWSSDGKYLAIGGSGGEIKVYFFTGSSLVYLCNTNYGEGGFATAKALAWSPNGRYLVAGGIQASSGTNHLKIYAFNGLSLSVVYIQDCGSGDSWINSISWTPDGKFFSTAVRYPTYLVIGQINIYPFYYRVNYFSSLLSDFSNAIIFGNSSLGSNYDLDVYVLGAARVGIYGKVWNDSVSSGWTFANRDSYVSLDRDDSKFKITNLASIKNWKKNQIIKNSASNNNIFLKNNQIWGISSDQIAPEETYEFMDNLKISENAVITFSSNIVVDGKSFDLIFGKRAQLLIDSGITVTFKNLNIKNEMNPISKPIIRCLGKTSKMCLDNVTFGLKDDFLFEVGQIFIHNDVEFTGTSKFSYRSVRPSYIASRSNLKFGPQATFEYYPGSVDNSLINMSDKSSSIMFDGSTLQTTHTGIRLTKGSLYFDNKVTLSSALMISPTQAYSSGIIFGNSALGSEYDVDMYVLGGANVIVAGKLWYDDVN